MKKLLHERLREWADSTEGDKYPSTKMLYATIESDHAPLGADDERKAFHLLADEIEKYYIPRPRFEDGEPVQFGKEFVDCNGHNQTLSSLTYTKGGHGYVSLNGWTKQRIDEPAKRPEPDSLEKLRDDMAEYKSDTHFAELKTEHTFGEFINRLTAIMERDA